ncbi:MAG: acyl-ACP--UDP-N-acetylglucosamine O-acyltransferase [Planctomycetes bacterium]|nr:acyl-ACP--UDP-N-acetylglucosamine O-acyltransferase [Planctomycetota bacterium]
MANIHPTAIVDSSARLGDDVEIGPYCIIERDVEIDSGTVLRPHAIVRQYTSMGSGNFVDSGAVLGGMPQDLKFDRRCVTYLRIGDNNVFREGVTISRATAEGGATIVGNSTYWMTCAHAGHDVIVGDNAILVNNTAIAGHCEIGRGAILSACTLVHQFCWVGDMVITQGGTAITMHLPPYTLAAGLNTVHGLNTVGLRRAKHISDKDRSEIKDAFGLLYRRALTGKQALEAMDTHAEWGKAAAILRDFVRRVLHAEKPNHRGLCPLRSRR